MKVKQADIKWLADEKLITVTAKTIWQGMKNGDNMQLWMENVPDEFSTFIRDTQAKLQADFDRKAGAVQRIYDRVLAGFEGFAYPDRKTFAIAVQQYDCKDILFLMFDERPWADRIWKLVEPMGESPTFKKEQVDLTE